MIRIKGHSNFIVEIDTENNNTCLIKKTSKSSDNERLKKQIAKQMYFINNNMLKVPSILSEYEINQRYHARMEYINNSCDCLTFIENNSKYILTIFINKLIMFIDTNIQKSKFISFPYDTFIKKYNNVKETIRKNEYINTLNITETLLKIDIIFNNINYNTKFPLGDSHGDLTLSNILIKYIDIYIFDFLDSFIETPLNDIVKLRQDTIHNWSLHLSNEHYDTIKLIVKLNYLDNIIHEYFSRYDFYNSYYIVFQIMNILRVLQYANNIKTIEFLLNILNSLIQ